MPCVAGVFHACFCFPRWHWGPSVAEHFVILNCVCGWFLVWWPGLREPVSALRVNPLLKTGTCFLNLAASLLWVLGWEVGPAFCHGSDKCSHSKCLSPGEPGRALRSLFSQNREAPVRFSLGPWTGPRWTLPGTRLPGQAASRRCCERRCEESSWGSARTAALPLNPLDVDCFAF